ncbi:MAG: hypoxanthine phosphoribosyltransferase [candidate division KSB1 bacterium]|nr:hypoxanthine phosphoribosyltransferase [candidate division KSB1 bacterium]
MNEKSEFEKVVHDQSFRCLLSHEDIQKRTRELGREITRDYRGTIPIIIGILNGSFIFIADLVRNIELDVEIDFLKISSYGDEKISSGDVQMIKDINADLKGRDVLIVEDIVDTGLSVTFLKKHLSERQPASIKFASLLFKKEVAKLDFNVDYVGFEIPNDFVVGFGLDHKQILRNLPDIYVMD